MDPEGVPLSSLLRPNCFIFMEIYLRKVRLNQQIDPLDISKPLLRDPGSIPIVENN